MENNKNEQIRQQAINKLGISILKEVSKNLDCIQNEIANGNSNMAQRDLEMFVSTLSQENDRLTWEGAERFFNCSRRTLRKLISCGKIKQQTPIKGSFSKRLLSVFLEECKLKNKAVGIDTAKK